MTKDRARELRRETSLPEGLLWRARRGSQFNGLKFRRQHPIGTYILDFYCASARLALEVDGGSHSMGDRPEREAHRDAWLAAQGIRCVRLPAELVLADVDDATRTLQAALESD